MSNLRLRPMRWPDIEAVHAIEQRIFEVDPWTVEQFWGELAQPTRRYLVIEDHEGVLGYAGAYLLTPEADVQTIAVDVRGRGQGLGRVLLEELIRTAAQCECTQLMLEVRSDNAAAIGMYERFGFECISTRRDYYAPGVDALIMRLRPLWTEEGEGDG